MQPFQMKIVKVLLLIALSYVITTTFQKWIGDMTIYSPAKEAARMDKHLKIVNNAPSEGKLIVGKQSIARTKSRVFTVYLADMLSALTGMSVHRIYRLIDTICLNLIFISLFMYLRKWFNEAYCLIGILYLGCILVLTYLFHVFHPWDRISLLSWIVLLLLLRHNKPVLFAVALAVSMTIKYDVILLPALYWMVMVTRENWKKTTLITCGLFAVSFGTYHILKTAFPASQSITSPSSTLNNILLHLKTTHHDIISRNIRSYPPFLVFFLPVILSFYRLKSRDRFVVSSAVFGFVLLIIFYLMTNFIEVRAELPALLLLLPAALMSLRDITAIPEKAPSTER